jgi:alpha-L-fucosidase
LNNKTVLKLKFMRAKIIAILISVIAFIGCSSNQKPTIKEPVYQASWESLKKHKTPEWFLDAKFGIYCHWGPYSVPAYKTEWYSHYMYVDGHPIRKYHEETYGPLNEFGYKDFISMFTAEKFNADEWAELFKKAGAKFAGPVTEHADGFAMWDSKLTKWNAAQMGPKRDVVGELAQAIRKQEMKFIATFHHQWKYAWYSTWDDNTDASNPELEDLYGPKVPPGIFGGSDTPVDPLPDQKFNDEWLAKIEEVVEKYNPDLLYFDNKMTIIQEKIRLEMVANYYNHAAQNNQDVVLTYKSQDLATGSAVLDLERARMKEKKDFPWLTDDSIDWGSWCNVVNPDYKSTNRLIDFLVDVVSKNGGVLLNVTPTAQGEIPEPVKQRLLEIGGWLQINGEAIYGTRPWKVYGEGPAEVIEGHLSERQNADNTEEDIRFTTKDGNLYAIVLDTPTKDISIRSLGKKAGLCETEIKDIEMIGSTEQIKWEINDEFLRINLPKENPCDYAMIFKLTM